MTTTTSEQRQTPRVSYHSTARLQSGPFDRGVDAEVHNLSATGMFVIAEQVPATGAQVDCHVFLGTEPWTLRGRVAWVRPDWRPGGTCAPAAGIQFVDLTRKDCERLSEVIGESRDVRDHAASEVAVQFEGMGGLVKAKADVGDAGLVLTTRLPFMRIGSKVSVHFTDAAGDTQARRGAIEAVSLGPSSKDAVPRLLVEVSTEDAADEAEREAEGRHATARSMGLPGMPPISVVTDGDASDSLPLPAASIYGAPTPVQIERPIVDVQPPEGQETPGGLSRPSTQPWGCEQIESSTHGATLPASAEVALANVCDELEESSPLVEIETPSVVPAELARPPAEPDPSSGGRGGPHTENAGALALSGGLAKAGGEGGERFDGSEDEIGLQEVTEPNVCGESSVENVDRHEETGWAVDPSPSQPELQRIAATDKPETARYPDGSDVSSPNERVERLDVSSAVTSAGSAQASEDVAAAVRALTERESGSDDSDTAPQDISDLDAPAVQPAVFWESFGAERFTDEHEADEIFHAVEPRRTSPGSLSKLHMAWLCAGALIVGSASVLVLHTPDSDEVTAAAQVEGRNPADLVSEVVAPAAPTAAVESRSVRGGPDATHASNATKNAVRGTADRAKSTHVSAPEGALRQVAPAAALAGGGANRSNGLNPVTGSDSSRSDLVSPTRTLLARARAAAELQAKRLAAPGRSAKDSGAAAQRARATLAKPEPVASASGAPRARPLSAQAQPVKPSLRPVVAHPAWPFAVDQGEGHTTVRLPLRGDTERKRIYRLAEPGGIAANFPDARLQDDAHSGHFEVNAAGIRQVWVEDREGLLHVRVIPAGSPRSYKTRVDANGIRLTVLR